jgi:hypothetical protein
MHSSSVLTLAPQADGYGAADALAAVAAIKRTDLQAAAKERRP